MCITFNMSGSLKVLQEKLKKHKIHDLQTLDEVVAFQNSFPAIREKTIADHKNNLFQEKDRLYADISQLDVTIAALEQQAAKRLHEKNDKLKKQVQLLQEQSPLTTWNKLVNSLRLWLCKQQLLFLEGNFGWLVKMTVGKPIRTRRKLHRRHEFLTFQFDKALWKSSRKAISQLDYKKSVIDKLSPLIYGALGEVKVAETLQVLPDAYYLINDYSLSFSPPIYNKNDRDYIKSIQIDHILLGPTGLFLIETKNWSEKSLDRVDLRSPVQQVRRTSYALYRLLNYGFKNYKIRLARQLWGDRKIPIKSLVVFIGPKPKEEFQFVTILGINELLRYINKSSTSFSERDSKMIADFLIQTNGHIIKTK
jgi:hypothetical protein